MSIYKLPRFVNIPGYFFVDFWAFPFLFFKSLSDVSYNFQSHERKLKGMIVWDHTGLHLCSVQLCGLLHHNGHMHTTTDWGEVQKTEILQLLGDSALTQLFHYLNSIDMPFVKWLNDDLYYSMLANLAFFSVPSAAALLRESNLFERAGQIIGNSYKYS